MIEEPKIPTNQCLYEESKKGNQKVKTVNLSNKKSKLDIKAEHLHQSRVWGKTKQKNSDNSRKEATEGTDVFQRLFTPFVTYDFPFFCPHF